MSTQLSFSPAVLAIDAARETERLCREIRSAVFEKLHRRGAVIGLSGGIDSSVTAALCVLALGAEHVMGLMMPEAESSPESEQLGGIAAEFLGITAIREDMTPILQACGCYERRDYAIRRVLPAFDSTWKSKIILPDLLDRDRYAVFSLVAQQPDGTQHRVRLTAQASLEIVAATNFKQRVRKMTEYHHADRLQYAVAGTPNRLEFDQGFFVKLGDGAADLKPIAHLYKSQVYQIAEYLGLPSEIRLRPPTTDTYSLSQSQEEFYFSVPLSTMDLCMFGLDHRIPAGEVAEATNLTPDQVGRIYRQIESKRRVAFYLHCPPLLFAE